jgi:hypothetical protein
MGPRADEICDRRRTRQLTPLLQTEGLPIVWYDVGPGFRFSAIPDARVSLLKCDRWRIWWRWCIEGLGDGWATLLGLVLVSLRVGSRWKTRTERPGVRRSGRGDVMLPAFKNPEAGTETSLMLHGEGYDWRTRIGDSVHVVCGRYPDFCKEKLLWIHVTTWRG